MSKAKRVKQISLTFHDRVGLLSAVTGAISKAKVNNNAICAYAMEGKAYFMLITDNNVKAKKAIAVLGAVVEEDEVVAVEMPNKAGELHKVAKKIADAGINIFYLYATTAAGKSSIGIFSTSDDKKAIKVINK